MRVARVCLALTIIFAAFVPGLPSYSGEEGITAKGTTEVREVVKKVQERYDKVRDLQAEFVQTTKIEGFEKPLLSSGRLYLKRPGRLRWDYEDPTPEEIYVTQNDVVMYVPEQKQVLVGKLTQMAASQAPLQLLQGLQSLEEHFALTPSEGGKRGEGGLPLITLIPQSVEEATLRTVSRIVLEIQPKTYLLKSVTIHEISGNASMFQFTKIKTNTGLKSEVFEFKTPEGVEVVRAPTLSPP